MTSHSANPSTCLAWSSSLCYCLQRKATGIALQQLAGVPHSWSVAPKVPFRAVTLGPGLSWRRVWTGWGRWDHVLARSASTDIKGPTPPVASSSSRGGLIRIFDRLARAPPRMKRSLRGATATKQSPILRLLRFARKDIFIAMTVLGQVRFVEMWQPAPLSLDTRYNGGRK